MIPHCIILGRLYIISSRYNYYQLIIRNLINLVKTKKNRHVTKTFEFFLIIYSNEYFKCPVKSTEITTESICPQNDFISS